MHAGQLRYHDFALLREAREQRKLRRNLSSTYRPVSVSATNNIFGTSKLAFSTPSTSVRFLGGFPRTNSSSLDIGLSAHTNRSTVGFGSPLGGYVGGGGVLGRAPWGAASSPVLAAPALPAQRPQSRTFLTSLRRDLHLKSLERTANAQPGDVQAQYHFLGELSRSYPEAVVARFEQYKQFAVDERVALLYLESLQRCGAQKNFSPRKFAERLKQGGLGGEALAALQELGRSKGGARGDAARRAAEVLGGGAGAWGGAAGASAPGVAGGRGSSPAAPLFVQTHSPARARDALIAAARQVLVAFVVVSALTVVFAEQGLGGRGGVGAMGNGKHIQEAEGSDVRFDDVKGVKEAKAELEEIVLYLKDPERFTRLGGKLPRGLLLTGPPGTGKTLLAKAIAGEAGVPFFYASGSQFEEVYVGLGAKRIRELFEAAKQKSSGSALIFIDEIDAMGGSRKLKDQSALKQTLNELLVQMDGFEENSGIIVIGATNFAESLDTALLRPGRFDKHVAVPLPDVGGRKEILEMYAAKTKVADDVDLSILARGTTGMSGADLYNLMNQAAVKASVDGLEAITMQVFEWAKDKILMGAERKSAVITPEGARCTAYHEAGHALVGVLTEGARTIHKATIMPRGQSLGMVVSLPGDETSMSYRQMIAHMDMCMGGRIAEELTFGEDNITSGASEDIKMATNVARQMVTKFGFSEDVGIVFYGRDDAGEKAQNQIDDEVKRLTSASYERARALLKKHSKEHKLLAETLLEYETLTGDEVRDVVLRGKKPDRPVVNVEGGSRGDHTILKNNKSEKTSRGGLAGLADKVRPRRGENR